MEKSHPFLKQAILGTATPLPWKLSKDVQELISTRTFASEEQKFLLSAAAITIYERAGWKCPTCELVKFLPCPNETKPYCSDELSHLMISLLENSNSRQDSPYEKIFIENLKIMAGKGILLSPELIPECLARFSQTVELYPILESVLGQRALWLAQFKEDWEWIYEISSSQDISACEKIWHLGKTEGRLRILQFFRQQKRTECLGWLTKSWASESPDDRLKFISLLKNELSDIDIPFLESVRTKDRAPKVRSMACIHLAYLRQATILEPLQKIIQEVMKFAPGTKNPSWTLDLSIWAKELPKEWGLYGIQDLLSSHESRRGQKETCALCGIGMIPPEYWETLYKMTCERLIASLAFPKNEYCLTILLGLTRATILHKNSIWAKYLWDMWQKLDLKKEYAYEKREEIPLLLHIMTPNDGEQRILNLFQIPDNDLQIKKCLYHLPIPWSYEFSTRYMQYLQKYLEHDKTMSSFNDVWTMTLEMAGFAISPEFLSSLPQIPDILLTKDKHGMESHYKNFWEILKLREKSWHILALSGQK